MFTLAALLFVTSKAQHAVWMVLPAALPIAWGVQWKARWRAAAWSAAALVLVAGAAMGLVYLGLLALFRNPELAVATSTIRARFRRSK